MVYAQTSGAIPAELQISHLCNRPYCIQPSHLYAGTAQDNSDDARALREGRIISPPPAMYSMGLGGLEDEVSQNLVELDQYDGMLP